MKLPILFFFLFFFIQLTAQSVILLEQDSVSQVHENVDLSDNFIQFPISLYYKNNTNENISVNWRREFGDNCPLEWDVFTADQLISYVPQVNESEVAIPMTPTDSNFVVRQLFYPRMVAGCCDIKMIFSLDGAPDNPIDTGYYHIGINATGCLVSSIDEEDFGKFNIYPNPTSKVLNIENGYLIESIEIIDLIGKIYQKNTNFNSNQIDVSFLNSGIYFCEIKTKLGKTLIQKFVKQ